MRMIRMEMHFVFYSRHSFLFVICVELNNELLQDQFKQVVKKSQEKRNKNGNQNYNDCKRNGLIPRRPRNVF